MALSALPQVNQDARALVVVASLILPSCAAAAASFLQQQHDRLAGALLLLSVASPTYMAYVLNVPALVAGLALLVLPSTALGIASE